MNEYQYCPKVKQNCLKDQPLLSVISQWFQENQGMDIDFNPSAVIYFLVMCLIAWFLLKILFRIVKSMIKPALFIGGLLIILYTKQFSYNADASEFVLNVISNTFLLISKTFETVVKVVFGVTV